MSRVEIEAEAKRLISEVYKGRPINPHALPISIAIMEFQNELDVDQICPSCNQPIAVTAVGASWVAKCPCGKSSDTWRGI
jgi:hypothetical protein